MPLPGSLRFFLILLFHGRSLFLSSSSSSVHRNDDVLYFLRPRLNVKMFGHDVKMNHAAMSNEERINLRTLSKEKPIQLRVSREHRRRRVTSGINGRVNGLLYGRGFAIIRWGHVASYQYASQRRLSRSLGTTGDMMASFVRLYVGIRSIGEGATQQQSGGVVLPSSPPAWFVFETWVELHQDENLICG